MYWHEAEERRPNKFPMCISFPDRSICQFDMFTYLKERKLDYVVAVANGWYASEDAGDGYTRVVIPAVTHKVGHVYWQARDIFGKAYIRYQSPKGPRYEALVKVTPITKPKGIVVVEGPMCALRAAMFGYVGIALMGMQPSTATLYHLALLLADYPALKVRVILDKDSAQHAVRVTTWLASQGVNAKRHVLNGKEKDLADMSVVKSKKELVQCFK